MKKYFYIIAVVALGITACSRKEAFEPIEETEDITFDTQVYHVCIPASMEEAADTRAVTFDGTTCNSTFSTEEKVYVYNKTKSTMLSGYLSPSNLSNDDKNCDLEGNLNGISVNDELLLLYNSDSYGSFYYGSQNGLATGVKDGAKADVTVSSTDPVVTTHAHFTNSQSMFRFKFANGETPIDVSYLILFTANNHICQSYDAPNSCSLGKLYIRPSDPSSEYLYLGISFYNGQTYNDKMIFIAYSNTNLYRATKTEPKGGFKHGKYYYNTNPIQMTNAGALQTPTITWTTPSSPISPLSSNYNYLIDTENAEISLSGTDVGYYVHFNKNATVHLNSLTATRFEQAIITSAKNLTLDVSGTNSFTSLDNDYCIRSYQTLKLQGNGTLTVRSNKASYCGIYGNNNYAASSNSNSTTTELDVSAQLAADGYTVTRSARTDNGDGTYTWTYTVAGPPIGAINGKFSISNTKQVYFSKGNLQYTKSNSTWSFMANQYDIVETNNQDVGANYANQDIVSLFGRGTSGYNDKYPYMTSGSYPDKDFTGDNANYDWGVYNTISNGGTGWRTLTKGEWEHLLKDRSVTSYRYAMGTVHSTNGLILFPDNFNPTVVGVTITSPNSGNSGYVSYSNADWSKMEAAGCVFLPAAGQRNNTNTTTVIDVGTDGRYWTSTMVQNSTFWSDRWNFNASGINYSNGYKSDGLSVRLVKDAN